MNKLRTGIEEIDKVKASTLFKSLRQAEQSRRNLGVSLLRFYRNIFDVRLVRRFKMKRLAKGYGFSSIDVETWGACNRNCEFCFNHDRFPNREIGVMKESLFRKIIDELAGIDFHGRISPYFYGEPLLDKRLAEFVSYIRKKCPHSYVLISTNGDLLTEGIARSLILNGVTQFLITDYEDTPQPRLMELKKMFPFFITLRHKDDFVKINRAGMLYESNEMIDLPCLRPDSQVVINWKGEVLLCCQDYYARYVFGNMEKETIRNIWRKPEFKTIRERLKKRGGRTGIEICRYCDYPGDRP